jgi:glycerol-3-phosphate acyltransferase PlsY
MDLFTTVLLAIAAFGLGGIPFSLLVGRRFLGKDIRDYADGNPGAANVFRAGGQKSGFLAVVLDIAKGVPFVFLAWSFFDLSGVAVAVVGMAAILGHAFSPFLHWRGGKSVAVTFGVLLALPGHEVLLAFIAFMVLGALFIEEDAWTPVLGAAGSLAYLALTGSESWELLLMLFVLALFAVRQFDSLHCLPGYHGRFVRWLQSINVRKSD